MSQLMDRIKHDQIEARKKRNNDEAALLTTLLSDIQRVGKDEGREVTDEDVTKKVKSFINNNLICIEKGAEGAYKDKILMENGILDRYIPEQMDVEDMEMHINNLYLSKGAPLTIKEIMSFFKNYFPGEYDGGKLKEVAVVLITQQQEANKEDV